MDVVCVRCVHVHWLKFRAYVVFIWFSSSLEQRNQKWCEHQFIWLQRPDSGSQTNLAKTPVPAHDGVFPIANQASDIH